MTAPSAFRQPRSAPRGAAPSLLLALLALGPFGDRVQPAPLAAQDIRSVAVSFSEGEGTTLRVEHHRGYPAVPATSLQILGWHPSEGDGQVLLKHRAGPELRFRIGSPYARWGSDLVQMVHAPYRVGATVYLPLQVVVDLLPGFLPRAYAFAPERGELRVEGGPEEAAPARGPGRAVPQGPARGRTAADRPAGRGPDGERRAPRVVIIDPGHGGDDPGATGPGGVKEKDVALAVGLALARELARNPEIEVRMTRDRDVEVPLWLRGEWATEWKSDRPGVFVSIHANSLPGRAGVRGFETYFLSEARTEHERRVAAAENAPLTGGASAPGDDARSGDPLLASILRDLRTFDHQHWSALLAEIVQREISTFHPGPDRGVKQGPFAVITNALMPSVLVEVGFLTNREEERLLTRPEFHRDTARALVRAIDAFFERYPPGGRE